MERPRDSPDCEALKTCFRLLALSLFVGGFAQAHDSVLLIVQEMIRPPFLKNCFSRSLFLLVYPYLLNSCFFPPVFSTLPRAKSCSVCFLNPGCIYFKISLCKFLCVSRCQEFVKWGDGNRRGFVSLQKNPCLIFDTVCPNHFLLCNLKRDPSVRLPVCFMPIHMQDIHYLV